MKLFKVVAQKPKGRFVHVASAHFVVMAESLEEAKRLVLERMQEVGYITAQGTESNSNVVRVF